MWVSRKFLLCLFFATLAGSYSLWLVSSVDKPLWADESITVALVNSVTLKHMFSAVLLGLDATRYIQAMAGICCITWSQECRLSCCCA
jgi:hypothetical protein